MPRTFLATIAMPFVFVVLWSTGFLGARMGLPHADPMTFLALRFGLVALVLFAAMVVMRAAWPGWALAAQQGVIGLLVHFAYLGGVFVAVSLGLEAGASSVIVGLQPICIALIAMVLLNERLRALQWLGMLLGLAGVVILVFSKLSAGAGTTIAVLFCIVGLISISIGSILQKRADKVPMLTGNAIQFAAASAACGIAALIFEDGRLVWTGEMIFALVWLVVVLSLGAITLYYVMIRRGAASEVASLFFLVPPCTALFAWPLFGETLGPVEIAGVAIAAVGTLLVNRRRA